MTFPEPPPTPRSLDREEPPTKDAPLWPALLLVALVAATVIGATMWLQEPPVKPTATEPSLTPHARVNPCAGDTFDANGCAVRMIEGASRETGVPPYTVVQVWCSKWSTPEARRDIVDKWMQQGAPSRPKARAVLNEILDYCPGMEGT